MKLDFRLNGNTNFYVLLTLIMAAIIIFYRQPTIAMWIGFALAGYSAIANDSIQTLGTFICSNKDKRWWVLWLFIGGIMAAVFIYGWFINGGDLAYGRLDRIPQPENISFLQLFAPVVLLILTRLRVPVSTTFLLLSVFSTNKTILGMIEKTAIGYIVAFVAAILLWGLVTELVKRNIFFKEHYNKRNWRILQWVSTGFLWTTWLMQDTANVTVFLPRVTSLGMLLAIVTSLFLLLGILLYNQGGRIQDIINEKKDVVDVRAATMIDFVFAIILYIFKEINNLPMSTTWVFLGLLAGRELALTKLASHSGRYRKTLKLVLKDIVLATIGLLISLLLAWITKL
jgi:hypothetical protein